MLSTLWVIPQKSLRALHPRKAGGNTTNCAWDGGILTKTRLCIC